MEQRAYCLYEKARNKHKFTIQAFTKASSCFRFVIYFFFYVKAILVVAIKKLMARILRKLVF